MTDDPKPLFLPIVVAGAIGAVILLSGLALFSYFEPVDAQPGNGNARITGVYRFDPITGDRVGASTARFTSRDVPAAVVDWKSLAPDIVVEAHWYDDNGEVLGGVGPAPAGAQPARPIPIDVAPGDEIPASAYVFVVERYSGGRSVQVLARSAIKVDG